jgi:hypothetical protein
MFFLLVAGLKMMAENQFRKSRKIEQQGPRILSAGQADFRLVADARPRLPP